VPRCSNAQRLDHVLATYWDGDGVVRRLGFVMRTVTPVLRAPPDSVGDTDSRSHHTIRRDLLGYVNKLRLHVLKRIPLLRINGLAVSENDEAHLVQLARVLYDDINTRACVLFRGPQRRRSAMCGPTHNLK
jgi:hypothetical protein